MFRLDGPRDHREKVAETWTVPREDLLSSPTSAVRKLGMFSTQGGKVTEPEETYI